MFSRHWLFHPETAIIVLLTIHFQGSNWKCMMVQQPFSPITNFGCVFSASSHFQTHHPPLGMRWQWKSPPWWYFYTPAQCGGTETLRDALGHVAGVAKWVKGWGHHPLLSCPTPQPPIYLEAQLSKSFFSCTEKWHQHSGQLWAEWREDSKAELTPHSLQTPKHPTLTSAPYIDLSQPLLPTSSTHVAWSKAWSTRSLLEIT